jgi:hypothetical protein
VADAAVATRYTATPWWLRVAIVFVASRIVTTAIILAYAAVQPRNPWTEARPGYFDYAAVWDGHWYYIISVVGYPRELPMTPDAHVGESAWAFMPAYPSLVRVFTLITGLDFAVVAVALSVAFALGTALLLYKLMEQTLPAGAAMFTVVLFCFAPLSPIYQVAYAESMHMFFLVLALYLLARKHYVLMLPVIAVMALTRPSGLAFALALVLHIVWRFWRSRDEPFPAGERVAAIAAAVFSGFMGLAWLLFAWAITGSPSAYTDTELAWRSAYIGYQELVPFTAWMHAVGFWARFGTPGVVLVIVAAGALLAFVIALFTPAARRLGHDIRFWLISYLLYLLAVFFPQSSTFRLLVPMFPALGILAQGTNRVYRVGLVVLCVAGQVAWMQIGWFIGTSDWTPP